MFVFVGSIEFYSSMGNKAKHTLSDKVNILVPVDALEHLLS
jgi:hypothetical protein